MADPLVLTITLHDLDVGIGAGTFDAEAHAGWSLPPRMSKIVPYRSTKIGKSPNEFGTTNRLRKPDEFGNACKIE